MEPPLTPLDSPLKREQGAFVFFSYSHRDKGFRDRLEEHLSNLKYRGLITTWHDREISAGEEWAQQIDISLNKAQVILLLISASFMASEYCYSIEMRQALERHERHEADVIPILLRPVLYTDAPFAKLQMLPTNGKPIVLWRDRDSAFVDVAYAIERVAKKYLQSAETTPTLSEGHPSYGNVPIAPLGPQVQSSESQSLAAPPTSQPVPKAHKRNLPLLLVGMVGLVICAISSASLVFYSSVRNAANNASNSNATATASFPTPSSTASIPTPTPTPSPSIPISTPVIILGLLLVIGGIAALLALGAIRAKLGQRRAQVAAEEARKRKYYEEAIEAYRGALARNPCDAEAFQGMGNAFYSLRNYDQSLDAFMRAIECDATASAYAGLGDVFTKLKRYSEAVDTYEKAIELDPTVTFNYADYIQALRVLGRKEEAEQVYTNARQLGYEDQE